MKSYYLTLLILFMTSMFIACGEFDNPREFDNPGESGNPNETSPEEIYARAIAAENVSLQNFYRMLCRCEWRTLKFSSEAECLAAPELHYTEDTTQQCALRSINNFRALIGFLRPAAECIEETALRLSFCTALIPETCSDTNLERWRGCMEQRDDERNACLVLHSIDDEWFNGTYYNAITACGLMHQPIKSLHDRL